MGHNYDAILDYATNEFGLNDELYMMRDDARGDVTKKRL
jgi:hypothetical protein